MPKERSSVVSDRKLEIRALIGGQDILPEKFVELALQQQDVQRVDVRKYAPHSWTPSKVGDIKAGFNAEETTEWILRNHGPGRYQLSVVMSGEYVVHKVWQIGPPETSEEMVPTHPVGRSPGAVEADDRGGRRITKQIADTIADQVSIKGAQDFLAEVDARQSDREIRPAQLMMQSMKDMVELVKSSMTTRGPERDPMALVIPLFTQMMTMQQTMFMAMIEQGNKRTNDGSNLKGIAEALTTLEKTLTGRIGELFSNQDEKGIDWARVAEVAAPIVDRALAAFETAQQRRPPIIAPQPRMPLTRPSITPQPAPTDGAPPTPVEERMKLHEDPEVDAQLHEAAALGVEMLKSRDFVSLQSLLDLNFPDFLERIDLTANPIIYVQWLKRLDPAFDKLRGEFADFMKHLQMVADDAERAERAGQPNGDQPPTMDRPLDER